MKKMLAFILVLVMSCSLVACGGSDSAMTKTESVTSGTAAAAPMDKAGDFDMNAGFVTQDSAYLPIVENSQVYSNPNAKIIRSAELTIQTTDFEQAVSTLAELTEQYNGYYESARMDGGGYYDTYARRSAQYTVRIPKESFTAFRDSIGQVGHLYSIYEDTKDVGEEYYDTEARLQTLETKRERLLALLDKAEVMEDIISLESALADVQYQIDMYTSTLRKYDSLIDYSTFHVYLNEVVKISQDPGPEDSFGTKLKAAFERGFERFGDDVEDFFLWIAGNVIGIILFIAVIILAALGLKSLRKKRKARILKRTGKENTEE